MDKVTAKKILPILGPEGWVTDPSQALDKLYKHAFVTDFSQSTIFHGKVTSIQHVIARNPNNIDKITRDLSETLRTYIGRYFPDLDVTVKDSTIEDTDGNNPQKRTINIDIIVRHEGKVYSLGSSLTQEEDGDFKNAIRAIRSSI